MTEKEKCCDYCNNRYPDTAFGVALTTKKKIFRRRKCRHCYRKTKQILWEKSYLWMNEYKSGHGCCKCGVTNPIVLDFHHKDGTNKEFGIASLRREVGSRRLQEEIVKCEVLCANCHRIEHHEMKMRRMKSDGA